ncbi:MAG: four helix bundle protein [Patescibacteria group bacterium]
MIYDVTDLDVYNRSVEAPNLVYQLEKQVPQSHFKLKIQITSSAESVPALIAEGFGKRRSDKEWKRFLEMALGSSDETITHARTCKVLSKHFSTIDCDLCDKIAEEYKIISKQLNNLRNKWIDYGKKRTI